MPSPCRLLSLAVAVSFLYSSRSPADDRRRDPDRLSIATFNARFLFDGVEPDGEASFPWKRNPSAARQHVRDIAALLKPLDADLLHISEVEDLDTLKRLALEIGDPTYRAYLIPGRDDFTRQNVGLLTRIDPDAPLRRTDEWAASPNGGERQGVPKNYSARITVGSLRLTLIGAHLLAFPDDPERWKRREGQAEALRRFAAEEGTRLGRLVVLLGDLNDLDPELPDASGRVAQSDVLRILREVDKTELADDLWSPMALVPDERRFTSFADRDFNGLDGGLPERSLTDHVLLSQALRERVMSVEVFDGYDPISGPSDHFPLKVTLDVAQLTLFVRGDVNGDLKVDTGDAVKILGGLFTGETIACEDAADADDSGRVDLGDAIRVLRHANLGEIALPPPGPRLPGPDPSNDSLECR